MELFRNFVSQSFDRRVLLLCLAELPCLVLLNEEGPNKMLFLLPTSFLPLELK